MKTPALILLTTLFLSGCEKIIDKGLEQVVKKTLSLGYETYETVGSVELNDESLISKDAKIEKLGGSFMWSEGPVWIKGGDYLLFTDVPGNTIHKFKEGEGITTWMSPSGHPDPKPDYTSSQGANGLYPFDDTHIIVPDHGNRTLYKLNVETQAKTVLAERFEGKRFNSPNDAVLSKTGIIYFTDPPYGLSDQDKSEAKEISFNGVYALYPDGALALVDNRLTRPNGIALSPDERTLYVANSDPDDAKWMAYNLDENGMPDERKEILNVTADVKAGEPGLPDGMTVDQKGNLYATGPGGVLILSPAGERLGLIRTGTAIANCAFGDDGYTLYMTSNDFLARVRTTAKGLHF
ncbi:SMP-30/gluconolactonase/LRE family protein [Hellea balneolensis]|uniref:SMP-30/gluconolactonase/LRE family protein n=1 Tax=Hellea balneolensis TaxID=287478 RepID=UPI000413C9D4|nr:SMP-30/gluconolactonase/LRE family protein [Hellea balneolensis]